MTVIYHEDAADLSALAGQTVAVVGYGSQGSRAAGFPSFVGVHRDASGKAKARVAVRMGGAGEST
jgi:ketol-acid reductoisomerase